MPAEVICRPGSSISGVAREPPWKGYTVSVPVTLTLAPRAGSVLVGAACLVL